MNRIVFIVAFFWLTPVWANPVDIFGIGARAQSLGGAQAANPGDTSANYYNPGAITSFEHVRFDAGYQMGYMSLLVNDSDVNVDPHRGVHFGLIAPGAIGGVPFAIGTSLFVPDQHMTRTRSLSAGKPRFSYYNNRPQRLFLALNLGVEIIDGLRIGGGLSYMTRSEGTITLDGRVDLVPEASELQTQMDVDLRPARYGQVGIQYEFDEWLQFGLVYRTGFQLQLQQRFVINADIGAESAEAIVKDAYFELNSLGRDLYQPPQLILGFYVEPMENLAVSFDIAWHRWSTFTSPASEIEIAIDLGPEFNDMINLPPAPPIPPANFSDIIVPRLGVEWKAKDGDALDIFVRGGYAFENSPVPDQTGETNYIDNAKHTFSLGAGFALPQLGNIFPLPVDFNISLGMTLLPSRSTVKDSPIDPVGSYTARGRVFQGAFTTNWRF